ncbi:MAG: hypothetical protein SVS15_00820, partial [Thermodesulfobacteriota bacterium]|nr:hypothetical protein [Thermodesulfobacteriota bacterium]
MRCVFFAAAFAALILSGPAVQAGLFSDFQKTFQKEGDDPYQGVYERCLRQAAAHEQENDLGRALMNLKIAATISPRDREII